jgi:hypothetical protein
LHEEDHAPGERVPPLCLSRCSRGGKSQSLYAIAKELKKRSPETGVLYVTFNGFSSIDDDVGDWEQQNPIEALCRRIAFAAWKERDFKKSRDQYNKHFRFASVDRAWVESWLDVQRPCVLLIDELNLVKNLGRLSKMLKEVFLVKAGRYFVFSTHVSNTSEELSEYMDSVSARSAEHRALPLIP